MTGEESATSALGVSVFGDGRGGSLSPPALCARGSCRDRSVWKVPHPLGPEQVLLVASVPHSGSSLPSLHVLVGSCFLAKGLVLQVWHLALPWEFGVNGAGQAEAPAVVCPCSGLAL